LKRASKRRRRVARSYCGEVFNQLESEEREGVRGWVTYIHF